MPGPKKKTPAARTRASSSAKSRRSESTHHRTLLLIDNRPLQRAAWAEFHTARKRLEKTARDLHRHEEIDRPAYDAWLHRTFPVWVTTLRELYAEVSLKSDRIQSVLFMAQMTGRSPKKLWREQKEREANPEAFDDEDEASGDKKTPRDRDTDSFNDDDFFGDDESTGYDDAHDPASAGSAHRDLPPAHAAKDIYRRLVQHLHPDRGGEWNPARQRLWHEVQQAWAAGDADWLARLEVEWETTNEVLGPDSPISRLRRAITELVAARRDTERKLRDYRRSPYWRFTLSEAKRHILHARTYANFQHDVEILQLRLNHLNRTIAAWEKGETSRTRSRPRPKTRQARN